MTHWVVGLVVVAVLVWPGRAITGGLRRRPEPTASAGEWWRRRRRGTSGTIADLEALARVSDLLAMALRSGATPTTAVAAVAREAPGSWRSLLQEVGDALAAGGTAGGVWRRHAADRPELGPVAGAWALSEDLGVALAPSMATSARALRATVQARRRLEAATAGARATMHLLTLLPVVGLFAGLAFGLAPWEVYGHSGVTLASAIAGIVLTLVGWLVCRWVLARAVAPREET